MQKSVMCIVNSRHQAESAVAALNAAGFRGNDISALLPDKDTTKDFAHVHNTKAPEGAVTGAGAGGALGGTLGLLAGIGALAIPGGGPLIAAGPLLATLSGAAAGAAVGGLTGSLVGLGIPEIEAKRFEGTVRGGNILLSVHVESSEAQKQAENIFKQVGAESVVSAGEASVPREDRRD